MQSNGCFAVLPFVNVLMSFIDHNLFLTVFTEKKFVGFVSLLL